MNADQLLLLVAPAAAIAALYLWIAWELRQLAKFAKEVDLECFRLRKRMADLEARVLEPWREPEEE